MLCLALLAPAAAAAAPAPNGDRGPAASKPMRKVAFGAYIPAATWRSGEIKAFTRLTGRKPVIISSYKPWNESPFVRSELDTVWEHGAVPMVTWEPWSWDSDANRFPLREIAAGRFDRYVRRAARAAAAWRHPILVRFAHEMNGTWYPWGRGHGNTPRIYRRAWHHLVRTFRRLGADNVQWVWSANVNGDGKHRFQPYYPGDGWVDWVGLDGFNWANRGDWNSFTSIFRSSYDELRALSPRPVIITETASNETGGDKAAWVRSALGQEIPRFPAVRAVIWFDEPFSSVDARINSSPAAAQAFRETIDTPRYGLTRAGFLATPKLLPPDHTSPPQPPGGGFGEPSLAYRLLHKLHDWYLVAAIAVALAALAVLVAAVALLRSRLRRRPRNRLRSAR